MILTKFIWFLSVLAISFAKEDNASAKDDTDYDGFNLNEEDTAKDGKPCTKKDGTIGFCVPFTFCDPSTKTILTGGNIDTDLREFHDTCQKPGAIYWCCAHPEAPPPIVTTKTEPCLVLDSDICTWCVTLHKVNDPSIMDVEAYCAGALIGSKIILTAATCLIAAKQYTLFAQVPASPDKTRKYLADQQKLHPNYNSGTRSSDFGIIVLKEEVDWGTMAASGACLSPVKEKENCMTFGLDVDDNFASTYIEVSEGRCKNMGGAHSSEVLCGKSIDKECFAVPGAPVLCDNGKNGLELVGVTRSGCRDGNIALGSYMHSSPFILTELDTMQLNSSVYTA